jgi:hypothetical protein
MELVHRDYFKTLQNFDEHRKMYFHILTGLQDSNLLSIVSILKRAPYFPGQEELFSVEHIVRFADRIHSNLFSRYDTMIIDTLVQNLDFQRHVDSLIHSGSTKTHAISETFLVSVFNGGIGRLSSPAGKFVTAFLKWKSDRAFTQLSEIEIDDRIVDAMSYFQNESEDSGRETGDLLQVLTVEVCKFVCSYCNNSDDREIALIVLEHTLDSLTNKPASGLKGLLRKFYHHPLMSDREFWIRTDLIRRRMAAFLLLGKAYERFPEGPRSFENREHYRAWLEDCAGIGSLEQGKRLLEVQTINRKDPPVNDKEWAAAIKSLKGHFSKLDIRTKEVKTDDTPSLKVFYDPSTDERTESEGFTIIAPGIYYHNGERHWAKEVL